MFLEKKNGNKSRKNTRESRPKIFREQVDLLDFIVYNGMKVLQQVEGYNFNFT